MVGVEKQMQSESPLSKRLLIAKTYSSQFQMK